MNKDTIELERDTNHIYGYGRAAFMDKDGNFRKVYWKEDDSEVLDKLIEWSRENLGAKVYKHKIRSAQENISATRFYIPFQNDPEGARQCGQTPIPYCDLVYYLDIYWQ